MVQISLRIRSSVHSQSPCATAKGSVAAYHFEYHERHASQSVNISPLLSDGKRVWATEAALDDPPDSYVRRFQNSEPKKLLDRSAASTRPKTSLPLLHAVLESRAIRAGVSSADAQCPMSHPLVDTSEPGVLIGTWLNHPPNSGNGKNSSTRPERPHLTKSCTQTRDRADLALRELDPRVFHNHPCENGNQTADRMCFGRPTNITRAGILGKHPRSSVSLGLFGLLIEDIPLGITQPPRSPRVGTCAKRAQDHSSIYTHPFDPPPPGPTWSRPHSAQRALSIYL